jgi:NDP-sugar pyrophosphorylase family protein
MTPSRAMVLAAGLGTRMRPLTDLRPKPALPVLNRPLIHHVLEHLARHGVRFAVVNSHSHAEALEQAVSRWIPEGMEVAFSREKEILGTAGGLQKAARHFRRGTFYLVNSDSLTDVDLSEAAAAHAAAGRMATLVVKPHIAAEGYRPLEVAGGGIPVPRVTALAGRRWGAGGEERTFTGIHLIEPAVLDAIPPGRATDINAEVYPGLLEKDRESVGAWMHQGWWFEAGTPERYLELNLTALDRQGRNSVFGPGFFLDEEAQVSRSVIGEGCTLAAGARVSESVLWDNVTVGQGVMLHRCVVTDGVMLPMGGSWERRILMRGEEGVTDHPLTPS